MASILDDRPPGATADPNTVITEAAAATDALFARKPLDRRIDLQPGLTEVAADHGRLVEILTSLVADAIRFAEGGRVTIGAAEQGTHVELWVADEGAALSEAAKETSLGDDWATWLHWLAAIGGAIWIEPSATGEDHGMTVRLSVPSIGGNHG
ncbi:MAG: hypothetical protein AAF548_14380 [Actinomycetota bacterium]